MTGRTRKPGVSRSLKALAALALSCAAAGSAAGCESQRAPAVQGEPAQAPPSKAQGVEAVEPASPRAAEPSARVDLAKYEGSAPAQPANDTAQNAPAPAAAPVDKAALAAEARQGSVINDEAFATWLQTDAPLVAGSKSHVEAVLVAKAPYHCNAEYPHKFKLNAAPAGLSYPEDVVRGMQITPERGVLRIPVQAQHAGPVTVSGTLSFSVCTEERCLVEKRDLALNLEVK